MDNGSEQEMNYKRFTHDMQIRFMSISFTNHSTNAIPLMSTLPCSEQSEVFEATNSNSAPSYLSPNWIETIREMRQLLFILQSYNMHGRSYTTFSLILAYIFA